MQENELPDEQTFQGPAPALPAPRVRTVLFAQLGLFMFCAGVGVMLYYLICAILGWDSSLTLHGESPLEERWQVRIQLGLTHFFGFLVSGAITVWVFYRGITQTRTSWPDYLQAREWPRWSEIWLGILLMAVSIPLVLYSLNLNQQIPLPEVLKSAEDQAMEALKGLLQMEHAGELLANLVLIALLPAIGEELVFRGVIQQQLMRRIANPWVAIFVSAVVFSAMHFQFEGFLPRVLLGFLLGWLYWRTRNFWVPVVGHFFNNGFQVIGQYLYGKELSTLDLEKDISVPWEFAAISTVMVFAVMQLFGKQKT